MKIVGVIVAVGLALSAGSALAKESKDFLKEAIEGHNGDIVLGQLAQIRAGNDKVREFGRALAKDHADGKEQALTLAQKVGVTPPSAPSKEAMKEQDKLNKLDGAEFDREFVSYMVKDHLQDIDAFEEQAKAKEDSPDVARYAEATLPKLKQHLEIAENLEQSLKSEK